MTEEVMDNEEVQANPYNMRKEWHKGTDKTFSSADSLFVEESKPKATSSKKEAEAPEETTSTTNYKKRYDDLKKHYDRKVSEFKQKEQELLAEARVAAPEYKAPKSIEDLEKFKSQYPDLYETVETVAHLRSEEQISDIREQLVSIKQREADIVRKEAHADLKTRHPDFEEIRGDDNFHEWAKGQPEEIQNWIYNNPDNATLASRAIDIYKLENDIQQSKTSKSKPKAASAADMVSTKTKTVDTKEAKVWTEREIARMSIDQFDKYEDEINQAISEGRVIK